MNWIFDNDRPIYIQIVEQLKLFIVSGKLKRGEKLPSVRDLAFETKVNPNTMQKALVELENTGLIYTQRTNGKFVTDDKELIQKMQEEMANEKLKSFLTNMNSLGISKKVAIELLQKYREEE